MKVPSGMCMKDDTLSDCNDFRSGIERVKRGDLVTT